MAQIEYSCKDVVFHFNKKHLEDETVPMWVLKTHGETFYVNHVHCKLPWDTKETPDNTHTKGSIKVKECLLTIDDENNATIDKLTLVDKLRLRNQKVNPTRIITRYGGEMHKALTNKEFEHSVIKNVTGACSTSFIVCDMLDKSQVTFALLKYDFRILQTNEYYYKAYDGKGSFIDDDYYEDEDD